MEDYDGYNFDLFKSLAKDESLSVHQKIGFPDSYREGKEKFIFDDIIAKVPRIMAEKGLVILDIGPGCANIPRYLIELCRDMKHTLLFNDCTEMLDLLPDESFIRKIGGRFPDTKNSIQSVTAGVDVIICYSVYHDGVFAESNTWEFLDGLMELLNEQGQCIVGDIPNNSKRNRFFTSNTGIKYHQQFMGTDDVPQVHFNTVHYGKIDESVLFSMLLRCHMSGCDAYIVPQPSNLPFANRRDDLLIRKP